MQLQRDILHLDRYLLRRIIEDAIRMCKGKTRIERVNAHVIEKTGDGRVHQS